MLNAVYRGNINAYYVKAHMQYTANLTTVCYEMDKTNISMFEIIEPGGSALGQYIVIVVLNP